MKKLLLSGMMLFLLLSCRHDKGTPDYHGYPTEIGEIIVTKCAGAGCHNEASAATSAGLDLTSWESAFRGNRNNACIIPYRPDHSFLLFSANTFDELGPRLPPSMPLNREPLSKEEVVRLSDWIAKGAPDKNGFVKFSDNPSRRKVYVANQGCDLVTVFDATSKLAMRAIDVGNSASTESPHDMLVSPDGKHVYISFFASNLFQKYRTSDGAKVGELVFSDISWHSMAISGDSRIGITSHLNGNGKATLVDLNSMSIIATYYGTNVLVYPHGCILNNNGTLAYITSQQGNFIYRADISDPYNPDITRVVLNTGDLPSTNGIYKPYAMAWLPGNTRYAVTCQGTNELRVFNAANDSLIGVIPTSGVPQLMSHSLKAPYLFVSCMEDSSNSQTQSGVDVINYTTLQKVTSVHTGYQPRGLATDDENHCVWVANRNISPVGWSPHHTTSCKGKNGYITIIDINTLQLIPGWKAEVSVDPYCISIRE